jgi:hypothetical protein
MLLSVSLSIGADEIGFVGWIAGFAARQILRLGVDHAGIQ